MCHGRRQHKFESTQKDQEIHESEPRYVSRSGDGRDDFDRAVEELLASENRRREAERRREALRAR